MMNWSPWRSSNYFPIVNWLLSPNWPRYSLGSKHLFRHMYKSIVNDIQKGLEMHPRHLTLTGSYISKSSESEIHIPRMGQVGHKTSFFCRLIISPLCIGLD